MNSKKSVRRTGGSPLVRYKNWLFKGSISIPFKFAWTGMWIASMLTFQIKETLILWGIGIALTFGREELKNWEIDFEGQES